MLEYGPNANVQDRSGRTALHWAAWDGVDQDIVRQLLAHGADPNLANQFGVTPLSLAQVMKRPDIVALFKQAAAKK